VKGPLLVVAAIVVFIAIVLLLVYNRFVRLRNMVDESWHDIGTELQRRYDLIPNLVNTVKGYAAHEREVFDSVTALRVDAMAAQRSPDAQAPREQALGQGVARLMAVAENYPDLKANEEFLTLQRALVDTEDRIQVARRIYNANVRSYDTLIQSFPALVIARSFGFALRPYFEVDAAVRDAGPPSVDLSGQT
jgi:LemA protein